MQNKIPLLPTESVAENGTKFVRLQPPSRKIVLEDSKNTICELVADDVLMAHSKSCAHYFRCNGGNATEGVCEEGYAFDEDNQKCSPENEVHCILCKEWEFTHLPDPDVCNHYYLCAFGERYKYQCPAGQRFDRNAKKCMPRAEVQCDVADVCRNHNTTGTNFLVGDLNSCQKYV